MRVEVAGCENGDCNNSDPIVNLAFSQDLCPNQIIVNGQYLGCKSMCACQQDNDTTNCKNNPDYSQKGNPYPPGGYCGCPCPYNGPDKTILPPCAGEDSTINCSKWLNDFFSGDNAGQIYCNNITEMTKDSSGKRPIYCQAYDDNHGTRSYGNGVIKLTIYNKDFESIKDRTGSTACGSVPPTPQIPDCKTVNMQDNKCTGDQKYVCKQNPTDQSVDWKCQSTPFTNCGTQQCIKDNTPPPPSNIPYCSTVGVTGDQCGSNKYICTDGSNNPSKWGCSQNPFPNCNGTQCIKDNTPTPPPSNIPYCSKVGVTGDQCGSNKYICTDGSNNPSKWGCSQNPFPNCPIGRQCIKD
jgi:hypothetical protein